MDKLSFTKQETMVVNYQDLEKFATEHLGLEKYSFVATEECGNDSSHQFVVGKEAKWSKYDHVEVDQIAETKNVPCYQSGYLLELLHKKGFIPAGNYLRHLYT